MAHTSPLGSFDPFATHPFTNGSGLTQRPPLPTSYPVPIPSSHVRNYHGNSTRHDGYPALSSSSDSTSSFNSFSSSPSSSHDTTPIHSPLPSRPILGSPASSSLSSSPAPSNPSTRQIFVPFRKDASSPDLVLKKRSPPTHSQYSFGSSSNMSRAK
ncbi:hypothetical protein CPB83DRAFT_845268 [Crepidotus variabilis]|uniref:Uncharacterized protein n=1 Tax=Crepidotus variabilis TaxID=179855 RepID=A0A9P6ER98_9AGAR|nr:hypothetical protein CPB83DRAFT_845268 [Crepidotus variabilis]